MSAPEINKIKPIALTTPSPRSSSCDIAFLNNCGEIKGNRPSNISKKARPINNSVKPISVFLICYSESLD